ncbi:hypothetical protein KAR91_45885 [Candidatus Pacearchaeota archaeon]|nr:hypothetical protein [Candidatus Pacearchaeota archaeon]
MSRRQRIIKDVVRKSKIEEAIARGRTDPALHRELERISVVVEAAEKLEATTLLYDVSNGYVPGFTDPDVALEFDLQIIEKTDPTLADRIRQARNNRVDFDMRNEGPASAISPDHNIFNISNVPQDAMFWITLLALGRKNPKAVENILVTLFKSFGKAMDGFVRAGAANRISAWGSSKLLSLFMERFGLITQVQSAGFAVGLNLLTGMEVAEEFTSLIPWKALKKEDDFPTTLVLGSSYEGVPLLTEAK